MADLINGYFFNKLYKKMEDLKTYLENYNAEYGNFKKFTEAGSYTFVIPMGVEKVYVSGIGGGGGGASGAGSSSSSYQGGGGGSGGKGSTVIDQEIIVSEGEELTISVGDGGAQTATPSSSSSYGIDGNDGENTIVYKGGIAVLTALAGTGGGKGGYGSGSAGSGGAGGTLDGGAGANGASGGQAAGGECGLTV